jgi:hypothetical protein
MARKKSAEELEDEEGGATMDYGEEPDFSDPEDFVDNITDEVSSLYAGSSVADPGSGAFLISGSGIRDGYKVRIRNEQPESYFGEFRNHFLG